MIEAIDSPYIHAAGADTFQQLVLENSKAGPVLVNFWSKKAGPSLRQYPILDQLIHKYEGKVLLVNIDTDNEVTISKQYGIASVPTLKLFRHEVVAETLHGFQSADELSTLLEKYVARDSDQELALAIQNYSQGNRAKAFDSIIDAIVNDPANPRLPAALCKLLKYEKRYDEAINVIESLPPEIRSYEEIERLANELSFYSIAQQVSNVEELLKRAETRPDDLETMMQLSALHVVNKNHQTALTELARMMEIDSHYNNDYARKAILRIFNILGNEHELVIKFRPTLGRYAH